MQESTSLRAASGLTCLRGTKTGWARDSKATVEARSAAAARSVLRTAISRLSDGSVYHRDAPTCGTCARGLRAGRYSGSSRRGSRLAFEIQDGPEGWAAAASLVKTPQPLGFYPQPA